MSIVEAERSQFGGDHCLVGRYVGEQWGLPAGILDAIVHHHHPEGNHLEKIVSITHVAEVISSALNLGHREGNQVTYLSPAACAQLHINFTEDLQHMYGRMEARAEYACYVFRK